MRNKTFVRVVAALLLIALVLSMGVAAMAQEPTGSGDSPVGEIIPKPNSGEAPKEAGDRGGSLQLGLLGLIGVAIVGMALHVSRGSKQVGEERLERARSQAGSAPSPADDGG